MDHHSLPPEPVAPTTDAHPLATEPAGRRPFEPPRLLWSEPFEPVAYGMACAKQSGQGQQCNAFPQLS